MIEVQQQAFASVKETEAEEIVVEECCQRTQDNVDDAEADPACCHDHLRAQGRIAVHVLDVVGERGVGMVEQSPVAYLPSSAAQLDVLVDRADFKSSPPPPEES